MLGLLTNTLERVDSLQNFYLLEQKNIERKSKKGMKENRSSFLVELYLNMKFGHHMEEHSEKSFQELQKIMDKCIEIKQDSDKTDVIQYKIKADNPLNLPDAFEVKKRAAKFREFSEMSAIHSTNTLIMLIVRFEEFISKFVEYIYSKYPNKYLNHQTVTYLEICNRDIGAIQETILHREVESMMFQSYENWLKLFESHHMNFSQCQVELDKIKEIYARRNILVHNAGKVNAIYLKNIPNSKLQLNDYAKVDKQYLEEAFNTIKKIIFAIIIEGTRISDNKAKVLEEAFERGFNELSNGNYLVSCKVFEMLQGQKKQTTNNLLMEKINYWISIKELQGLDCIKDEIEKIDFSAYNNSFLLAKYILLEDYENATLLTEKMLEKQDIFATQLNEWPLFKNYRQTEYFEHLKKKFSKEFHLSTLETELIQNTPAISIQEELKEI